MTNNTGVNTFATQKADTATDQRDELAATASPAMTVQTSRLQGDLSRYFTATDVTVATQQINSLQAVVNMSYRGSTTPATQAAVMQQTNTTANQQPGRAYADLGNDPSGDTPYSGRDRYGQLTFTNKTNDSANARMAIGEIVFTGIQKGQDPTIP